MTKNLKGTVESASEAPKAEKNNQAYFLMKLLEEPVLPQDVYSVKQAARLLHISPDRLRSFSHADNNPFPIRHYKNGARGTFILRDEMINWLMTNTVSSVDEARERRKAKYTPDTEV